MKYLIILFCMLSVMDYVSTYVALSNGGIETNVLVSSLLSMENGWLLFGLIKCASMVLIAVLCVLLAKIRSNMVDFKRATSISLIVLNIIFVYVVLHNFQVINY